jgi:hypothetical protein
MTGSSMVIDKGLTRQAIIQSEKTEDNCDKTQSI